MNLRRFFSLVGLVLALGGGLLFLDASPALAQVDGGALAQVGEEAQLGTSNPRVVFGRLINIFLGVMGVVLLGFILYAGFLWMTAGGDTEKVDNAKKTIRNAIIGLTIIVCSWAIVTFLMSKALEITQGDGDGFGLTGAGLQSGALGSAGTSVAFQVQSIAPVGPMGIRNIQVRFLFSREVLATTASSSIKVIRVSNNEPVEGVIAVEGTLVTFTPSQACPAPNADRRCFVENAEYIARVEPTLRSTSGLPIACGSTVAPCEARFQSGPLVDVTPPVSVITTPLEGQGIPLGDTVRIIVRSTDEGGVSLTEVFADGVSLGKDAGTATTTPREYDATILWDTRGVATGTHRLEARVWDADSNSVTTTPVTVVIRPRHAFNGVQDGPELDSTGSSSAATGARGGGGRYGETGVDCGGPSGGGCAGASCTRAFDCSSGACITGRCVEQPIIGSFTPTDGRPGTFVTITGANFGTTPGQVRFGNRVATAPAACTASASFWSPTQIVVAVPVGAATSSPIQVTHGGNRLSDATNDERGPRLADFRVNGVARPGLCAIRPGSAIVGETTRLAVAGVNLGTASGQIYFNTQNVPISAWRPTGVDLSTPLVLPGTYAVRARTGGLESNPVSFRFDDRVLTAPPVIESLRPATGTVGTYVTLTGRNFGNAGRVFFRNPATNAVGEADTRFPAQCGSYFWSDTSVMVKVPRAIRGGLGEEQLVRPGRYQVYIQRDGITMSNQMPFTVVEGTPGPGICSIQPLAGPVGTGVTIFGEGFGTRPGSVTFAGTTSTRPAALLTSGSWRDGEIRTRVPVGASTGMVRVSVGSQQSNDARFSVASCLTNPGVCGPSLACCPDGSCAVGGVCPALGVATSTFAWRTSTGRIFQNPRVIEECNNQEPPSPSPRSLSTCVNAEAVIRFTTHVEQSTAVDPRNVIVRRCTGTTGDPCASGTPEVVQGSIAFLRGLTGSQIVFTPTGNLWAPSSTYQIILTTGIRTPTADGGRPMLENAELYGRGNAYAYRFRTKQGSDLCTAGSVSVVPSNWVMNEIGERKEDYTLSARASDDMCVQINGATLGWGWTLGGPPGRATIEPSSRDLRGAPLPPSRTDIVTVVGRGATDRDPVLVNVNLVRPAPPAPVQGTGRLSIRLTPPRVVSYAPNCNEACVNAAVWARFNVAMDQNSLFRGPVGLRTPNVEIKRCTNESCEQTDQTLDLSQAIIDLMTPEGTFATNTLMKIEPSVESTELDPVTRRPMRRSQLEPGKFYKATILGGPEGLRSAYGQLPLTDLNDTAPLGFTWKFRVKTGPEAYCSVERVQVVPSQKYEQSFGMRQLFIASPISAPDSCSRDGQMLISERSTQWTTSDDEVADFVRIGEARQSISIADSMPEFCTNQCLNAGSNGVFGQTAVCGNGTIETTNTNYCRHADPTRTCVVGGPGCVTPFGDECVLLPEGSTDAEECDNRTGNGAPGSQCSARCLFNPALRVTETGGTCGNGRVDRGEQCDAGRACVGGATAGRDCTSNPSVCGTGSVCQVVERRGCSDRCQALGANRGGSTCGNGDVSNGETCDYTSGARGSGCTSQCLNAGSSSIPRRLCGNGDIEAGESCEMQTPGDPESAYCSIVGGVRVCVDGSRFAASCNPRTCLNLGTNRCQNRFGENCCGNNEIEAGEDCDGGPGCSARCLKTGSSSAYPSPSICGDRVVGTGEQCDAPRSATPVSGDGPVTRFEITNRQLFEIVGLREPTVQEMRDNAGRMSSTIAAQYMTRRGEATYGVQCNFTRESDCRTQGTGLTSSGCCATRPQADPYPRAGSTDVCRNVLISASFNQLMDEGSVRGNFLISTQATGEECPAGTNRLDRAVPTAFDWSHPVRSFIARIRAWFTPAIASETNPWCTGTVAGTVVFERDEIARRTTAVFLLDEALATSTKYQVTLLGDPSILTASTSSTRRGIRGANGIYANGNISWQFMTGERICTVDELRLTDTYAAHPTLFYRSNEAHRYIGRAISYNADEVVPLSPIAGLYDWAWREWLSSRPSILRTQTAATTPQISIATTTSQNQRGTSLIATGLTITADRVNVPSTRGRTLDESLLSTVLLCDNPWLPPGLRDGQPPRFEDETYNFAFNYCLDAGNPGTGDDLPELVVNRLAENASDTAQGVKRQYIFSFSRPSFRSDAIGLRIMGNPLHLSPRDWYRAQGFAGSPQSTSVDGYEAIRDGSSLYISGANLNTVAGTLTTDIYVFSHNPNALPETRTIFEQIIASLTFNTNIRHNADNVCRTSSGAIFRTSESAFPISCTADWECVKYDAGSFCASAKEKLQRDLKRMADLQFTSAQLEAAKARDGRYPTLSSGTFLQTFVTSRWPSWQSVFAASVGTALPEDPLNIHVSCGQCASSRYACMEDSDCGGAADRCVGVDGHDPLTCWNAANSTYRIPMLEPTNPHSVSRLYQYRSVDGGTRYELGTELEYLPIENYTPAILPETRRCVSTNASNGRVCIQNTDCNVLAEDRRTVIGTGVCTPQGGRLQFGGVSRGQLMGVGGICGDGVVGTDEVCEPGQTRDNACTIAGVEGAGRRRQVCQSDCRGFVDAPGSSCVSAIQCGNGRIEAGEVCDDGDLNGRYGHCNRSCTGYAAMCGDGLLSGGETCDLGASRNGLYCDTRPSPFPACTVSQSCSLDCRSLAPHCGDGIVQTESNGDSGPIEQCDGNAPETTTRALCMSGRIGEACTVDADCSVPGSSEIVSCGNPAIPSARACSLIKVGLCAGGLADRQECRCPEGQDSCMGTAGTDAAVCGPTYRCVMYATQRTRSCIEPGPDRVNQCKWNNWSDCRPANFCGDGIVDPGEMCDDGNRNDNDACTNRCVANVCGDGVMHVGVEECDYGSENGQGCTGAEYGSTCGACTNQCRMTASSGGYCGNGIMEGTEQCDATDFRRDQGAQSSVGMTCTGLGFDYAERVRCRDLADASRTIEVASSESSARCFAGTIQDIITCGGSCGYAGCKTCTGETGTATITAVVRDAVYSRIPVAGATVTLLQNGRRITTQSTDTQGRFTFTGLNGNAACGGYRIYVEYTRDNAATTEYNEGTNGGYWMYESNLFSVPTFERQGIESNAGFIYLIPRVAADETMAVHTWNGSLQNRYLLAHLILPPERAWDWGGPGGTYLVRGASCGMNAPINTAPVCLRDIHEQNNGGGFQGHRDLSLFPNARLFCPSSGTGGGCYEVNEGPQALRYKIRPQGIGTGPINFFLTDQVGTNAWNDLLPSYQFYRNTQSRVWVVTQSRIYKIEPPAGPPTRPCHGKYWHVYQQDAETGEITPSRDADDYLCGGDEIPGERSQTKYLPTSEVSPSWLHFGGRPSYDNIDWDLPSS